MADSAPIRIAVDAMGGDNAPGEIVRGALLALERDPRLSIMLVGDDQAIAAALEGRDVDGSRITVHHASQVIAMGESPVEALRRKPDTSIRRCAEALRRREVDAIVSAGDTGGVVASSTIFVRRLKGVKRHGIAIPVPTAKGASLLIDVGANVQCKPIHLVQYAIMATAYAQDVLGIENPSVGLLSVGEEEAKGSDLVKKARTLLSRAELNFIGNVEGQAIFEGVVDVIVCDGFVGNVILKVSEGLVEVFVKKILGSLMAAGKKSASATSSSGPTKDLLKVLDYSATGGAPLLGVRGVVIICHGRSKANAIANAIGVAKTFTKSRVNERIVEAVAKLRMRSRMAEFIKRDHGSG